MAEQLKAMYDETFLREFGDKVHAVYRDFDTNIFIATTMDDNWKALKLKERIRRISEMLGLYLPTNYEVALEILFMIDAQCVGFPYLFFPDFIEVYGQAEEHWDLSMIALERFTAKSSSEFAVRVFLLRDPKRMMRQMEIWAKSSSEHVRRLASEGCRPRLPWGQSLPLFKQDPTDLLPVLELLKADSSLYVRKSVANNLNDITKDNPAFVLNIARRWKGSDPHTDWIIRHGCRTLIRKANQEVLALFGYAEMDGLIKFADISVEPPIVPIGGSCMLSFEIEINTVDPAYLRIEYGIDFIKKRGQTSRKLFMLSDKKVPNGKQISGTRTHRWANLTTRHHYPGTHRIALIVNGVDVASTVIELVEE